MIKFDLFSDKKKIHNVVNVVESDDLSKQKQEVGGGRFIVCIKDKVGGVDKIGSIFRVQINSKNRSLKRVRFLLCTSFNPFRIFGLFIMIVLVLEVY